MKKLSFKDKKVLVFGLGILGGGIATTNWLLKQGARVTITDLKDKNYLQKSLKKIRGRVKLSLAGHKKSDIDENEIIVVNPDVSLESEYIKYAFSKNKVIENEGTIFFKFFSKSIIGITGTRGKTTTAYWTNHLLSSKFRTSIVGNSTEFQFLKILEKKNKLDWTVAEMPSFHLELFKNQKASLEIAVITNVFRDHLNRHKTMENYALAKANLFKNQNSYQHLILNQDNKWTLFFKKLNPKVKVWHFSLEQLGKKLDGVYFNKGKIYFQFNDRVEKVLDAKNFIADYGEHNLENFLASVLAAHLAGCSWKQIASKAKSLPEVKFRQELIFSNKKLKIINDTSATSPEGGIAVIKRFRGKNTILITGGTDRDLDFSKWAEEVRRNLDLSNIIFISGSATKKMLENLKIAAPQTFGNLKECVAAALKKARSLKQAIIVFSPASKSFEKFKNEYDRGEKFNKIIKQSNKNYE